MTRTTSRQRRVSWGEGGARNSSYLGPVAMELTYIIIVMCYTIRGPGILQGVRGGSSGGERLAVHCQGGPQGPSTQRVETNVSMQHMYHTDEPNMGIHECMHVHTVMSVANSKKCKTRSARGGVAVFYGTCVLVSAVRMVRGTSITSTL